MYKPLTKLDGPYTIYDSPDGFPPKGTAHYFEAIAAVSKTAVNPFKNEPIPPKSPKSHKKKKGGRSRKSKRRR